MEQQVKKKTILVAEDEESLLKAISSKLEKLNFTVLQATSVEEGMKHLQNNKVDAIWLDHYLLGKKNGLDLVLEIKQNKKTKPIPIFVVSNTCSSDKYQNYIEFGIERFFVKSDNSLESIINEIRSNLLGNT